MKADGLPCAAGCGVWIEHEQFVCPICKEDRFCSSDCFWKAVPSCSDYKDLKEDIQPWTPRSVVDQLFVRIRQDRELMKKLSEKREDYEHMIVFYIQDEETLAALLSNNTNWKEIILNSVESRASLKPLDSVLSFQFAIYCSKTKSLTSRLL